MNAPASFLPLCLVMSLINPADVLAQNDSQTEENRASAVPSKSSESAIERFVKECIDVKPGEKNFPAKFTVGVQKPLTHEVPSREEAISYNFRVSKFETTQELYQAVTGKNPSRWKGPRNSVENVRFSDAVAFCEKLTVGLRNKQLIAENEVVRLPTSIEWEYCCRAGSTTRYCFGDAAGTDGGTEILNTFAWHTGNAAGNDPAVGVLKPNAWGLYDVHGYLWEFVSDDVPGNAGERRVVRGGSWKDKHPRLSSSTYFMIPVDFADDAIGFRCIIAENPSAKKLPSQ